MYGAIKALLLAIGSGIYPANVIFQAYQNNYPLPQNSQYIIMTQGDTKSISLMPGYLYDATNEIDNFFNIDATDFQVDFYGNPASAQANLFRLILQTSYGTEILSTYGVYVYEVKKQRNLTSNFDRDMYLQRFNVKFSLFNDNTFTPSSLGFIPSAIDNLYLVEVQI